MVFRDSPGAVHSLVEFDQVSKDPLRSIVLDSESAANDRERPQKFTLSEFERIEAQMAEPERSVHHTDEPVRFGQ